MGRTMGTFFWRNWSFFWSDIPIEMTSLSSVNDLILGCSLHCTFEITWRLAGSADVSSASEAWESIIRLASRQAGVHVDKIDWFRTDFVNWSVFCAIVMINENYFAANGCSLLFFDRQARRLSDERYGKYHADETSALPGGLSVILSNSGFFVPFYIESRLHP